MSCDACIAMVMGKSFVWRIGITLAVCFFLGFFIGRVTKRDASTRSGEVRTSKLARPGDKK